MSCHLMQLPLYDTDDLDHRKAIANMVIIVEIKGNGLAG
jgi:hypothetical protein